VDRFEEGEKVYACGFLNPKGGFYAEYATVDSGLVSHVPDRLTIEQAGAMSGVSITALRGLDDVLALKPGDSVMIFGASGGVGHVAVQLAKLLGADAAANGRTDDMPAAIGKFAPGGLDAALLTAGGEAAEKALRAVRDGGRVALPKGIQPEPNPRPGVRFSGYYGAPDSEIIGRLDRLIGTGPFEIHVAQTFPLDRAADAQRALDDHYLGKLALRLG
jgi:NADPH2:quinone reductase